MTYCQRQNNAEESEYCLFGVSLYRSYVMLTTRSRSIEKRTSGHLELGTLYT